MKPSCFFVKGEGAWIALCSASRLAFAAFGKAVASEAVSSCLQAALAERSDGSERSEAKQKSSPPYNPLSPTTREVAALRVDLSGAYAPYFKFSIFKLRVLASKFKNLRLICDFGDVKFWKFMKI